MSFADAYLARQTFYTNIHIDTPSLYSTGIIVVIPSYNEPNIISSLMSLRKCAMPQCSVEVIVAVNDPINSSASVINQNLKTISETNEWAARNNDNGFFCHSIYFPSLPRKHAGAGLARKLGMNEAIYRFNKINMPDGIIISFDADSICSGNYLLEIEKHYKKFPKTNGTAAYFEHPISGSAYDSNFYLAIVKYELFLRYYLLCHRYTEFPYAFHTVGSCFSVKASTYIKQGGMNMRTAGEDFYFLQKIIPLGHFYEINTASIIPSPRSSQRVPFGTGASIKFLTENPDSNYEVYNFDAFNDLKNLFQNVDFLFENDINEQHIKLSVGLTEFLESYNFSDVLHEIRSNASNIKTFRKRFFHWFNMFRIMKYLNFVHKHFYKKMPLCDMAIKALKFQHNITVKSNNPNRLLKIYREIDKGTAIFP